MKYIFIKYTFNNNLNKRRQSKVCATTAFQITVFLEMWITIKFTFFPC